MNTVDYNQYHILPNHDLCSSLKMVANVYLQPQLMNTKPPPFLLPPPPPPPPPPLPPPQPPPPPPFNLPVLVLGFPLT